jgi:transcriptional regulator with XRE-family HTH domain
MTATERPIAEIGQQRGAAVLQVLKRYRRMTDNELAAAIKRSRSSVQGYVAGTNQLTIGIMYDFARALDVDPAVFLMEPNDALRWVIDNSPSGQEGGVDGSSTRCAGSRQFADLAAA